MRESRLRPADRQSGNDPHAALGASNLRGQLRLPRGELPALAAEALLARLVDLSKGPPAERERADREALPPSPRTVSTHVVEALGDGRRVRITAVTNPAEEWGFGGSVVSTASPAAAAIRLLARGRLTARGARRPSAASIPTTWSPELEHRGCEFHIESSASSLAGDLGSGGRGRARSESGRPNGDQSGRVPRRARPRGRARADDTAATSADPGRRRRRFRNPRRAVRGPGRTILSDAESVFGEADLVLKVKEPQPAGGRPAPPGPGRCSRTSTSRQRPS